MSAAAADIFIIDGYNLLHRVFGLQRGAELAAQRARLEVLVRDFLRTHGRAAAILVWDGALDVSVDPTRARPFPGGRLEVLFSRAPESADERILALCRSGVARGGEGARVTVVTSDRKDIVVKLPRGVRGMSSEDFAQLMEEGAESGVAAGAGRPRSGPASEKPLSVSEEETAEWLEAFADGNAGARDPRAAPEAAGTPARDDLEELDGDEIEEWLRAFTDDETEGDHARH